MKSSLKPSGQARQLLLAACIGALIAGSIVFLIMNHQLEKERRRVELTKQLFDAAVQQIPKPPFPPFEATE